MESRNENVFYDLGTKFKEELDVLVQQVMIQKGVKKNADLTNSVDWDYGRNQMLMYVNDYYYYVSTGRKPRIKKIPINALISFIKKNNITSTKYSTNELAWAMQNSIYKAGIKGKNFIQVVEKSVTDFVEIRLADFLEEVIADSMFAAFRIKK